MLKALGACLRSVCRATDEPARYGGEELAVVVHGDLDATIALAERLREAIERSEVVSPEGDAAAAHGVGRRRRARAPASPTPPR